MRSSSHLLCSVINLYSRGSNKQQTREQSTHSRPLAVLRPLHHHANSLLCWVWGQEYTQSCCQCGLLASLARHSRSVSFDSLFHSMLDYTPANPVSSHISRFSFCCLIIVSNEPLKSLLVPSSATYSYALIVF